MAWPSVLAVLVAATVVAGLAVLPLRQIDLDRLNPPTPAIHDNPALTINETGAWVGTCQSGLLLVLGTLLTIGAAIGVWMVSPLFGAGIGFAALLTLALRSIRVSAGVTGLTVWYTPFLWPRTRLPLTNIAAAEAIDVAPMKHGGWGYRGSMRLFGAAAVVLRRGEGIRLVMKDNRVFVVTVDDAKTGARVINDLLAT